MSPKLRNFIATIALSLIGFSVLAQKGPPAPDTKTPPGPGLVMPIDDHIIVLVIMGLLIGFFYVRKNINKTASNL